MCAAGSDWRSASCVVCPALAAGQADACLRRSRHFGQAKAQFRVCADPENMPFSNQKLRRVREPDRGADRQGLRRDAELHLVGTAARLHPEHDERDARGRALRRRDRRARQATTWSARRGPTTARRTCSSTRRARGSPIKSLDDPVLKKLKIGVHLLGDDYTNPPPVHELSQARHRRQRGRLQHVLLRRESAERDHRCGGERHDRRGDRLGAGGRILRAAAARAAGAGARFRQARATCRSRSTSRWASRRATRR